MISDKRANVTIATVAAALAVLAIAAPAMSIGQPVQFLATLGGILLGPGALACRLATGSRWTECLILGLAIDVAALMVLALTAVAVHFWQPKVELIIPAATCVLAIVLYRRTARTVQEGDRYGNC
jgi:hypothetical protein